MVTLITRRHAEEKAKRLSLHARHPKVSSVARLLGRKESERDSNHSTEDQKRIAVSR